MRMFTEDVQALASEGIDCGAETNLDTGEMTLMGEEDIRRWPRVVFS
jgi:hypothetical protein